MLIKTLTIGLSYIGMCNSCNRNLGNVFNCSFISYDKIPLF